MRSTIARLKPHAQIVVDRSDRSRRAETDAERCPVRAAGGQVVDRLSVLFSAAMGEPPQARSIEESAMGKLLTLAPWPLAAFIAYVFLYYLQFKFTGHQGSVDLFTTLTDWLGFHGHEKLMRIGTGSMELLASILLFIPATQIIGAALAVGIMTGAVFFHLASPLGIDPYGDGGVLFKQACAVWLCSVAILALRRREAVALLERYLPFVPIPSRLRAL
jgi:hypothetical protein